MSVFRGASLRIGMVVGAYDVSGAPKRLSVGQARTIGQSIDTCSQEFVDAHLCAIHEQLRAAGHTDADNVTVDEGTSLMARFAPGLILDFPTIRLEQTPYGPLELRTCITVCALDAKSKIWTRCVTAKPTEAMNQADLDAFHSIAMRLCNSINESTRVLYERTFAEQSQDATSDLRIMGQIKLMSVDCNGDQFKTELEQSYDDISWSVSRPKVIEKPEIADALRFVTNLPGTPTDAKDALPRTDPFELSEDATFYPFMADNGAQSIFVAHAQGSDAYMYGVVGPALNSNPNKPHPASVGLSAELASYLGSAY